MSKALKYLCLLVAFAFIASGVVVAAFMDSYDSCGNKIYLLLIPVTAMFMLAAEIDIRFAVPRLLMRQHFVSYCLCIVGLAYCVSLAGLLLEYLMRVWFDLPLRITYYFSPWVLVDSFTNSIMLSMILLGIGALQLYKRWSNELEQENNLADSLKRYISAVRTSLDPVKILGMLDEVELALKSASSIASSRIRELAGYLRHQLYELPNPPAIYSQSQTGYTDSSLTEFLVSRRYRLWRHLIFQIILATISFGTFFNTPDVPVFTLERLGGVVCMYLFLNFLTYINILWLFRSFKKHHDLRKYGISVVVFIIVIAVPMIVVQIVTYEPSAYNDNSLPISLMVVATVGSMLTMAFFIGGVGAILFLQDWIIGTRRLVLLQTETIRQEYGFLRKQINPHFLFNVLNNVGILADEDPRQASEMLEQLKILLQYQFAETDRGCASVAHEVWFLRSYLNLEMTRIEPFEFTITTDRRIGEMMVPTLIFITFVENAVKYSTVVDGRRYVNVSFAKAPHGMCLFKCVNSFSKGRVPFDVHSGGLGLSNTRRRLAYLYGKRFSLSTHVESEEYVVTLTIPTYFEDEMSYRR